LEQHQFRNHALPLRGCLRRVHPAKHPLCLGLMHETL